MTDGGGQSRNGFLRWLDELSWSLLLMAGGLLALAPFQPEPHLLEKIRMLMNGTLQRPIDIFDLVMHGTPLLLAVLKAAFGRTAVERP